MIPADFKDFLEEKYREYNQPSFIAADPICIPHRFTATEDIEIAGLLASLIAWGNRKAILKAAGRLMDIMGGAPYDFVMSADAHALERLNDFVYRTFQGPDGLAIVMGLRRIYRDHGGLEAVMALPADATDTSAGILGLRKLMLDSPDFPARTQKHIANPAKGSSAKRLNMFLRWMVRKDSRGVDFGIWNNMRMSQLICPLDVHTGTVGRKLGLLERKQNDWKAALELTGKLREFDAEDPVKYDFSLFGLGIYEKF
ncbi:MAG: TIGR02757 family protein [Bacteroidota bacterium]